MMTTLMKTLMKQTETINKTIVMTAKIIASKTNLLIETPMISVQAVVWTQMILT